MAWSFPYSIVRIRTYVVWSFPFCPPQELDPVTLHNQALMNIDESPTQSFEKLQFLLQQIPCPPETFPNLLLLYVKHEVCMYVCACDSFEV